MSLPAIIRAAAVRDIEAQVRYLQRHASLAVSIRFFDEIERLTIRLGEYPMLGAAMEVHAPHLPPLRSHAVPTFPRTLLIYTVGAHAVEVLRVLDGSRDLPEHLARTSPE